MANQALIEGAWKVAQAGKDASLAGMEASMAITSSIVGASNKFLDAISEEGAKYDEHAQKVIDEAGMLSEAEISGLYDELQSGRNNFIWGNKKDKTLAIRDLNLLADGYQKWETLREKTADYQLDKDEGFTDWFKTNPQNKDYFDILSGKVKMSRKDGVTGAYINGKFMSSDSIEREMEKGKIDTEFKTKFENTRAYWVDISSDIVEGQNKDFPLKQVNSQYSTLLENHNLQSVASTKLFGNTNFIEDRYAKLVDPNQGETYESLGITEDMIKNTNVNVKDGISPDEGLKLINALMNNDNALKQELAEYLTIHTGNQWDNAYRKTAASGYEMRSRGKTTFVKRDEETEGGGDSKKATSLQEQINEFVEEHTLGYTTEEEMREKIAEAFAKDIAPGSLSN